MAKKSAAVFFVTGKGGAGKSTVSPLLVRGAKAGGLRAKLIRVRDMDARDNLSGLLQQTLRFRFLSDRLLDSSTFNAVAAAAPGLADLASISAIVRAAAPRSNGPDIIVVDAPASGQSLALLQAPGRVLDLVGRGPVATIARETLSLISDVDRFRAVVVTIAEDLSIAEATELTGELRNIGVEPGPAIINAVLPELATAEQAAWLLQSHACRDAERYLNTRKRQLGFAASFEGRCGAAIHIPFRTADQEVGDEEAKHLLAQVMEGSL